MHDTRIKRGRHLEQLVDTSAIDHLLNIKARNSIEHFDEKIDKLALKDYKKQIRNSIVLYNMTISSKEVINAVLTENTKHLKPYYLKVYVIDERTAYIDNKSLNLAKIKEEAVHLEKEVSKIINEDSPGGLMKIIK